MYPQIVCRDTAFVSGRIVLAIAVALVFGALVGGTGGIGVAAGSDGDPSAGDPVGLQDPTGNLLGGHPLVKATVLAFPLQTAPAVEAGDAAEIEQDVYRTPAGDRVRVDISLDDVDEAYVLVGGDELRGHSGLQNYLDVLYVDGDASFVINTRLVGTDRPSSDVYRAESGTVISYAHGTPDGAETNPADTDVFSDVTFEDEDGNEVATTLAEFRSEVGISSLPRPLQPSRYRLVIGGNPVVVVRDDGVPAPKYPQDRSNLILEDPELGEISMRVLPPGNANEIDRFEDDAPTAIDDLPALLATGVDRDTITPGDRLLFEIDDTTGIYGAFIDATRSPDVFDDDSEPDGIYPAELGTFLERHEGVDLTLRHTNPGKNRGPSEVDLGNATQSDVYLLPFPTALGDPPTVNRFYLMIDTRGASFERPLEDGDEYELELAFESPRGEAYRFPDTNVGEKPPPFDPAIQPTDDGTEHFPYFGPDDTTVSTAISFDVESEYMEYGRTSRWGDPLALTDGGQRISGETNLHPETDVTVQIVGEEYRLPTEITIEDVDIGQDGTFAFSTDLSMLDADDDVRIEFYTYESLYDKRPLHVFESTDEFSAFEVTRVTTDSFIEAGSHRNSVSTRVKNTGYVNDTATVELRIDGSPFAEEDVTILAGKSRNLDFDDEVSDLDPGEYTITIRIGDDEMHEQLVVPEGTSRFQIESLDVDGAIFEDQRPTVNASVVNHGTIQESDTVEFRLDSEPFVDRTVELGPGEGEAFEVGPELPKLDPGAYRVSIHTDDDYAERTLVVQERTASFEIRSADVESELPVGGEPNATLTVENDGTIAGSGSVHLRFDDEAIDETGIDLDPGEATTVDFHGAIGGLDAGIYNLTLATPDDEKRVEVVVGTPEDRENSDDLLASFVLPPGLVVGSREVFGATAIVSSVYLLGHWI